MIQMICPQYILIICLHGYSMMDSAIRLKLIKRKSL